MKKHLKTLTLSLLVVGTLAPNAFAEDGKPASAAEPTPALVATSPQTLVTINGQAVSDLEVLAFNALQGGQNNLNSQQAQVQLLNQLVNTSLLAQEAKKHGLDKLPQVVATLKMTEVQVLAEAQVNAYFEKNPVTEEEIKAAYDKKFAAANLKEYKVRHILVKDEKEAREIIEALDKGEDFAKLAKERSLDASKDAGGELGWVGRNQLVKPFGDAMITLDKGKHTTTPVQTQFGWHVIDVVDIRDQQPPPLDQVKEQIKLQLQQQKLAELVTNLRKTAKIEVAGAEQPESPAAPAPGAGK